MDAVAAAQQICDEAGLDTLSAGVSIAFAMECFERGLLARSDTGGIDLRFGNHRSMIALLQQIARREGLGDLLAEGTRHASGQIANSAHFAMNAKGLELGGYECRGLNGQALQFAVSPRGGCHHAYGLVARAEANAGIGREVAGKGDLVREAGITRVLCDATVICSFARTLYDLEMLTRAVNALTGRQWSTDEMRRIGLRVMAQERLFNWARGSARDDDRLPERLLTEPLPDGPDQGAVVPLEALKDDFYQAMGWDIENGRPLAETLRDLEIDAV
jgi:aldehyde:ferredoxin oxidoreductase